MNRVGGERVVYEFNKSEINLDLLSRSMVGLSLKRRETIKGGKGCEVMDEYKKAVR